MATFALLDQAEEDALHKSRLLNVEEKPFKRITKRLLAQNSLIHAPPQLPPTPPPDASAADEEAAAHEARRQQQLEARRQWREDVLLDFAAFDSSIVRIQFLLTSNIKERERYTAEKLKIEAAAQAVKDNTADLRVQLEDAQRQLALRKEYDVLAEKITSNRLLRPREDQHVNIAKLNGEIADLQRESQGYAQTWAERRSQFGRIIDEGMEMRRQIRAEKEEVERREGMEGGEDGDEGSQRGRSSRASTPGAATPSQSNRAQEIEVDLGRLAPDGHLAKREKSPLRSVQTMDEERAETPAVTYEDTSMAEDGEVEPDGDVVAAPVEGLVAEDEKERGEEDDGAVEADSKDHMDTS
ncbi:hypothetical protein G7Y79_00015g039920 [Physcia stellaris]|nr:hypothetical protein G7Y79_00015g039920 [Physcia stellaris]